MSVPFFAEQHEIQATVDGISKEYSFKAEERLTNEFVVEIHKNKKHIGWFQINYNWTKGNIELPYIFLTKQNAGIGTQIIKCLKSYAETKKIRRLILTDILQGKEDNLVLEDRINIFARIGANLGVKHMSICIEDYKVNNPPIKYDLTYHL
ncbi:MAG: hypothetical protein PHW96_01885 [Candidatus Nanoarchaeia archaeon]|nr:hypothetical protein [Candidatus Nanoarchaeia archaeon]